MSISLSGDEKMIFDGAEISVKEYKELLVYKKAISEAWYEYLTPPSEDSLTKSCNNLWKVLREQHKEMEEKLK